MRKFSLLWPAGQPTATAPIASETIRDLELAAILRALCSHSRHEKVLGDIFYQLCLDPATIRYRQLVLTDLLAQPLLAAQLAELLPLLEEIGQANYRHRGGGDGLPVILARARELELMVALVEGLAAAFAAVTAPLDSAGLVALRDKVGAVASDHQFQALAQALPPLLDALRSHASITIGVNLDHHMRPEAAVLLGVNQERFSDSSLLDRLLGKGDTPRGIAPLHKPPAILQRNGPEGSRQSRRLSPLMVPLFQDLAKVMERIAEPVARELKRFAQLNSGFLAHLYPEILFYLQALGMVARLSAADMPLTFPAITPAAERRLHVQAAYNLQLALRALDRPDGAREVAHIVANDITFADSGRIAILTGPNRGGKTTYMQSIGLVHVLAQIGLPVPGREASLSPVDAIYTHYPVEEKLALGTGRFGDEALRLRTIFEKATRHSLVLLNESLATTGLQEGLYLARDIVRALRQIGLRAVFTTHLHQLAEEVDILNTAPGTSGVISLVASRPAATLGPETEHNYRVAAGPPLGRSYAEQIAARYGIGEAQLQALLADRGFSAGESPQK